MDYKTFKKKITADLPKLDLVYYNEKKIVLRKECCNWYQCIISFDLPYCSLKNLIEYAKQNDFTYSYDRGIIKVTYYNPKAR